MSEETVNGLSNAEAKTVTGETVTCCVSVSERNSACSRASCPSNGSTIGKQKIKNNNMRGLLGFMSMKT